MCRFPDLLLLESLVCSDVLFGGTSLLRRGWLFKVHSRVMCGWLLATSCIATAAVCFLLPLVPALLLEALARQHLHTPHLSVLSTLPRKPQELVNAPERQQPCMVFGHSTHVCQRHHRKPFSRGFVCGSCPLLNSERQELLVVARPSRVAEHVEEADEDLRHMAAPKNIMVRLE